MRLEKILPKENLDLINEIDKVRVPEHVAIIMDGNGRWATKKGLPRSSGHNEGVNVLKEIVKVSKNIGIKVLTVYAFSTENWTRPEKEVDFLIKLFDIPINIAMAIEAQQFLILWIPIKGIFNDFNIIFF